MSTPSAALATHGRHPHAQLVSSYPSTSHIYPNHNSSSSNGVTYAATNVNTSAPATSMSTFAAAPSTASLGGNTTTVRGFDARDGHDQAPYSATLNDYAERDAELLGQGYPMATTQAPATTVQAPPHSAAAAAVPDTTDLLRQHYDGSIAETTLPPPQYLYQYMNMPAPAQTQARTLPTSQHMLPALSTTTPSSSATAVSNIIPLTTAPAAGSVQRTYQLPLPVSTETNNTSLTAPTSAAVTSAAGLNYAGAGTTPGATTLAPLKMPPATTSMNLADMMPTTAPSMTGTSVAGAGAAIGGGMHTNQASVPSTIQATQTPMMPSQTAPTTTAEAQRQNPSQLPASASSSQTPRRRRHKDPPNWAEFYKNGTPKEIIVILDDDEAPPAPAANATQPLPAADHQPPPVAGPSTTTTAAAAVTQPAPAQVQANRATKRRRTGPENPYELGYYGQPTWSANTTATYPEHSPHASLSGNADAETVPVANVPAANRRTKQPRGAAAAAQPSTTNVDATATDDTVDLTSPYSSQASYRRAAQEYNTAQIRGRPVPLPVQNPAATPDQQLANQADAGAGTKRKRQTRKSVRDEQKRLEVEATQAIAWGGANLTYVPPRLPARGTIKKAQECKVATVHDPPSLKYLKVDDDDGHYVVNEGALFAKKYRIVRLLGQGTFGKVIEAEDIRTGYRCAIKIIRAVSKYREASKIELRVLKTLADYDQENNNRCIHLRDVFDYRNHICIVTDLLASSVFDFLKQNRFTPFPSSHIQAFARQLFISVAYLHDLHLIHTDLKPENILLVDDEYQTFTYNRTIPSSSTTVCRQGRQRKVLVNPEIRLIDFGSATFNDEYHSNVVSTRHYRAPEIILNVGWSYPCDIWSIGCILVEFFTGDALFQTHDNLEHLAMMEQVCGYKIDSKLARRVTQRSPSGHQNPAAKYFVRNKLDYPNSSTQRASRKFVKAMKELSEFISPTNSFNRQFLDLLRRIFVYDPADRITAKQALEHPWFKEHTIDDGTEAMRIGVERRRSRAATASTPQAR